MSKRPLRRRRLDSRVRRKRPTLSVEQCEDRVLLATFFVTDAGDLDAGGVVPGSLRAAILEANASPGPDQIDFAIGSGLQTIRPAAALPAITDLVFLNGESQPGFVGTPIIELDGSAAGPGADGLTIVAGDSVVRGLVINRFDGAGIRLLGGGFNTIEGNYIGTDPTGQVPRGNFGDGVLIEDSSNNLIGGFADTSRNVISANGAGSLVVPTSNSPVAGLGPARIAAGDFDGDGTTDLVTVNGATGDLSVLFNDGEGGFRPATILPVFAIEVATGDFDGDAVDDIAALDQFGGVVVIRSIGDGTFEDPLFFPAGFYPRALAVTDFDGDGPPDVAVSDLGLYDFYTGTFNNQGVLVLPGNGDGTLLAPRFSPAGDGPAELAVADFDGDGRPDLAVVNSGRFDFYTGTYINQGVRVLLGNGDGTFRASALFPAGVTPADMAVGDFNGDGRPDLAVVDLGVVDFYGQPYGPSSVTVLLNRGDGTLQAPVTLPLDTMAAGLAAGDFDGDGRDDLVTADSSGNAAILLLGRGDGTFAPPVRIGTGLAPVDVTSGDFNGDGRVDFAVANTDSNDVTVVRRVAVGHGVRIRGGLSSGNLLVANIIGADARGLNDLGNQGDGVRVEGASFNAIGTFTPGAANLISGNAGNGVTVLGLDGTGFDATGNTIEGNFIGTDLSGSRAVRNDQHGVSLVDASFTTIGGFAFGSANVIAGNGLDGIRIAGPGASDNLVVDNFIGVVPDSAGGQIPTVRVLANGGNGVTILDAPFNTIGAVDFSAFGGPDTTPDVPFFANVISGNLLSGVLIAGPNATGNILLGNAIGITPAVLFESSFVGFGNNRSGVDIQEAPGNTIGGLTDRSGFGPGNIISDNVFVGLNIVGRAASGNLVQGNMVGFSGREIRQGNRGDGVLLQSAPNNTIGGAAPQARNVIDNNGVNGVDINSQGATGNLVQGNLIVRSRSSGVAVFDNPDNVIVGNDIAANAVHGIAVSGPAAARNLIQGNQIFGNALNGVNISGAPGTIIGGAAPGAGNIIVTNSGDGIALTIGQDDFGLLVPATGTVISGNFIGADPFGQFGVGNRLNGISLLGAHDNLIGGLNALNAADGTIAVLHGNVISGNGASGILVQDFFDPFFAFLPSTGNRILGNLIGTGVAGFGALGNQSEGIFLSTASGNVIGGLEPGARNVIANNRTNGITIANDANFNRVLGNFVGLDIAGNFLGNFSNGVQVINSFGNLIGGTEDGAGNVISGNLNTGVLFGGGGGNTVQGNLIGTDASGTRIFDGFGQALGNLNHGVSIESSGGNLIGGTVSGAARGARNVISGNITSGVQVTAGSAGNVIQGNYIGTDATGSRSLGNRQDGIVILANSSFNTIGGAAPGEGNVISGNNANGVNLISRSPDDLVTGNVVVGNFIGTDARGVTSTGLEGLSLGNGGNGVFITNASGNTVDRNVISGNDLIGVDITGGNARGNAVTFNRIGTDALGITTTDPAGRRLGNATMGVVLDNAPSNPVLFNIIAGNRGGGILITGALATGNFVADNFIGTSADRRPGLGNLGDGVAVVEAPGNTIHGNTIAANNRSGVLITGGGARETLVQLNTIGGLGLGNLGEGVTIVTAPGTLLMANVIDGNTGSGVALTNVPAPVAGVVAATRLFANTIGTLGGGNRSHGVALTGSSGVVIGDPGGAGGNVIVSNAADGIHILNSNGNMVQGNIILGNRASGVFVDASVGNTIGAANGVDGAGAVTQFRGNLISANVDAGVEVLNTATATLIIGNRIGTDFDGQAPQGNLIGVRLNNTSGNSVGGATAATRNLISGNLNTGVLIQRATSNPTAPGNVVQGNFIGTNRDGTAPIGNGAGASDLNVGVGVAIVNAANNTVGGTSPEAGNLISGNDFAGVSVSGRGAVNNRIQGNTIGAAAGGGTLANTPAVSFDRRVVQDLDVVFARGVRQDLGVIVVSATNTAIVDNTIADNIGGVELFGDTSPLSGLPGDVSNVVSGNTIARNSTGVYINQAMNNAVAGNTLQGNVLIGVAIVGNLATNNLVQGNQILDTLNSGVYIEAARNNVIGARGGQGRSGGRRPRPDAGLGNTIRGSAQVGVFLFNGAVGNSVRLNTIDGRPSTPSPGQRNGDYGVLLFNAAGNALDVARSGPDTNRFRGHRIANFREFTGPQPTRGTPRFPTGALPPNPLQ